MNQRERRKQFERALKDVNYIVWTRDHSQCVLCGSGRIMGKPYVSGAHHIYSRRAHPEFALDPTKMCLLCIECHDDNANTRTMVERLLEIVGGKNESRGND